MKITVKNKKLLAALEDEQLCRRRYGAEMAKKISVRVASLSAAASLADFWPPMSRPERCHELRGKLDGTFSFDLKHPYRLLFKPAQETNAPAQADERQRWQHIEAIEILDIEDTHG
jgi:plasmid maintenance system killer protein